VRTSLLLLLAVIAGLLIGFLLPIAPLILNR